MRLPFLCAAAVLALAAAGCSRSDPERELRATIGAMSSAIEQRQPAAFLDSLADDFTREAAAFDKTEARRLLAGVMLRNARITLTTVVQDVRIVGDRAEVRMRVLATGGEGLLPERGQAWDVETAWRRTGGKWQLYNADWRAAL